MALHRGVLSFRTQGHGDVVDLSEGVGHVVEQSGVQEGIVTAFVPGSTAAVTTIEYEPGLRQDLRATLDRLIPPEGDYAHNRENHDTNAHAHVRAAIFGPSEAIPVEGGRMRTGTWQQLVLVDFDDRPRERTVIVTVIS